MRRPTPLEEPAAGDGEIGPGDVRGGGRGEPAHRLGDLLGARGPSHRNAALDLGVEGLGVRMGMRRDAGRDDVDAHAVGRLLDRERTGEDEQGALGGGVGGGAASRAQAAQPRAAEEHDRASPLAEGLARRGDRVEGALDVAREQPAQDLGGEFRERTGDVVPDRVHQHVETAVDREHALDEPLRFLGALEVHPVDTALAEFGDALAGEVARAAPGDVHRAPLADERPGGGEPEPAHAPGDQRDRPRGVHARMVASRAPAVHHGAVHPDPETLRRAVPAPVTRLVRRLREAGYDAWVVGGSVRDLLAREAGIDPELVGDPEDWDVATSARPDEVKALFRRVRDTGVRHGTVTVLIDDLPIEVTTYRTEFGYSDGRRPDRVEFVRTLEEDLSRRDFTINAIALDPLTGELRDPHGGLADLAARRLRAVGDPAQRFAEDGLRPLRALRFAARLELELDPATEAALRPALPVFAKVAPERVRVEWWKALEARAPSRFLVPLQEHGLLGVTAPELEAMVGCEQNRHHAYDVWEHTVRCVDLAPRRVLVRVAALLHDAGKPATRAWSEEKQDWTFHGHERIGAEIAEQVLGRLRCSKAETRHVVRLVRHHLLGYRDDWSDAAVRRFLRRVGEDLLEDLFDLWRADTLAKGTDPTEALARGERLRERVARELAERPPLTVRDLAIGGDDLRRELGLREGPLVGRLLERLLEDVLADPSLNEPETLLARARQLSAGGYAD